MSRSSAGNQKAREARALRRRPPTTAPRTPVTAPRTPIATPIQTISTFTTSPYDAILDLLKGEYCKLYLEATEGLTESNQINGKKVDYDKFSKLMGKSFKDVTVMEVLMIPTKWDNTNVDAELHKILIKGKLMNLFNNNKVTTAQVKAKSELVWSKSKFGATTPKYHKVFVVAPVDDATLNEVRNKEKMKHVITSETCIN